MSHTSYIAIGGNLGDRYENFRTALGHLNSMEATRIRRWSSVYESEPHGKIRNWFLNGVAEISTELEAVSLLEQLQTIEDEMGRKRKKKTGSHAVSRAVSRTMDLDILFFDSEVIDLPKLVVPHPRIAERRFVLMPMCELAPTLVHPVAGCTVSALLASAEDDKRVRLYKR